MISLPLKLFGVDPTARMIPPKLLNLINIYNLKLQILLTDVFSNDKFYPLSVSKEGGRQKWRCLIQFLPPPPPSFHPHSTKPTYLSFFITLFFLAAAEDPGGVESRHPVKAVVIRVQVERGSGRKEWCLV